VVTGRRPFSTAIRLGIAAAVGAGASLIVALEAPWQAALLLTWVAAALTWVGLVWSSIAPMDAAATARYATREDPHGPSAQALLLSASLAGLGAVVLGILKAAHTAGSEKFVLLASGVAAIIASWGVVHTVFTLRYAGLYYKGVDGGVSFNQDDDPSYLDFAYLAFTVAMTYQVSDTNITTNDIRRTVLRHALMSYLLGTVIIAATINLAAGLAH
jgi:uncharacterized membrane protein